MNQTLHQELKSAIEHSLRKSQTPGAAVAIRLNGEPFCEMGVGYQDLNYTQPLSKDASFYIYSVTKSLLATASLDLVGKGILNLDDSVQHHLPDFSLDPSITIRHLLGHTSGLPDYGGMSTYFDALKAAPTVPWSEETFLNLVTQERCLPPGTDWQYSNIGYLVLKRILKRITGLSMQQLLHQVIFSPLALQSTFVPNTLDDVTVLTPGYTAFFSGTELQDMSPLYHPGWVSHGVVISTAPELAKMIEALFLNQILSSALIEQMLYPVHILGKYPRFEKLAYGLGLFIDLESPHGLVAGHTGEGPGYSVAAFHFPNLGGSQMTIAAITNQDRHDYGLVLVYKLVEVLNKFLASQH
ncbi:beta-lactamase family protein [Leptolyngbya sp. NK1-12]|uniref:Beta-lactamase family protein n=1 Tax=Leptolyngbya sp. NK1-12 TaxID=2547451 RepID=A0AA96WFZ5_9CYAN|nr:serine hydrolase domain-containing protein [Leptolyngbya sp. NK1-12]WNZ25432.1 beta-lactamase family protein [Leptolyngbya sp. NK1-12]